MALNKINVLDKEILIAYEPVWAIGVGTPATVATIKETVDWVKEYLLQKLSINMPILYGGSVSKTNCAEIVQLDNVDGFLIGTSSLDVSEFYNIYSIMNER
jgi:triosephosphate isomerase